MDIGTNASRFNPRLFDCMGMGIAGAKTHRPPSQPPEDSRFPEDTSNQEEGD